MQACAMHLCHRTPRRCRARVGAGASCRAAWIPTAWLRLSRNHANGYTIARQRFGVLQPSGAFRAPEDVRKAPEDRRIDSLCSPLWGSLLLSICLRRSSTRCAPVPGRCRESSPQGEFEPAACSSFDCMVTAKAGRWRRTTHMAGKPSLGSCQPLQIETGQRQAATGKVPQYGTIAAAAIEAEDGAAPGDGDV